MTVPRMTSAPTTKHEFRVEVPAAGNGANKNKNGNKNENTNKKDAACGELREHGLWAWAWLVWERRRFLVQAMVCGLAVSTLLAWLVPKRYDSTTRLMPPDGQSGSGVATLAAMAGKSSLGMGSMAGDLLGLRNSGALFVDILRSRTVEDRVVGRLDLRKVYGDRYWADARKRLEARTEISQDRKSEVITLQVSDRDPRRAAQMAEAYVEELDRVVADVSTSSARRERIFIEQRLQSVKQELDQAAREFSQFASQNAAIDIPAQGKAIVEVAGRLQGELIASQSELEGLEQVYTANNVRVRSLHARVGELSKQLDKLSSSRAPAGAGMPDADGNAGSFPSLRQLPLLGMRWADLYRQTKIEETVYELLTQQYELAKIEEAKEIPTVKILDAADVPERRSSPKRTLIVLLGGLFSLLGAAVWVGSEAIWHRTSSKDSGKMLVLAVWSRAKESSTVRALRTRWKNWEGSRQLHEETEG